MRNPRTSFSFRRSLRLPGYDYSQAGVYFVTLCAYRNSMLFGSISNGTMFPNDLGIIVRDEWFHIQQARPNVQLDGFALMPNHLHGLLFIDESETGIPAARKPSRSIQAGSLGAIVSQYKAAVSRRAGSMRIWQRNYYEHIVRCERSLNTIRKYILENPARWQEDNLYVD